VTDMGSYHLKIGTEAMTCRTCFTRLVATKFDIVSVNGTYSKGWWTIWPRMHHLSERPANYRKGKDIVTKYNGSPSIFFPMSILVQSGLMTVNVQLVAL
jgi:hypothetical protein